MTVKELIEVLQVYKVDKYGRDIDVYIRDNNGDLFALSEDNITIDSDNDIILNVEW